MTGALLLGLLVVYLWVSVHWSRQHSRTANVPPPAELEHALPHRVPRILGRLFVGLLLVLLGSRIIIICVTIIARRVHIPEVVISATLVACGTSLPECMVAVTALRRKHPELLVGNVVGADILNILFVTGAAALAKDLPIVDHQSSAPYIFLTLHLPTMLLVLAYFRICIAASVNRGHFRRWMGIPLLTAYVIFTGLSLMTGSVP